NFERERYRRHNKKSLNLSTYLEKLTRIWTLRRNFSFAIETITSYLQISVVDSEFSTFISNIQDSSDLSNVSKLHQLFLERLLNKSFLNTHQKNENKQPQTENSDGHNTTLQTIFFACDLC